MSAMGKLEGELLLPASSHESRRPSRAERYAWWGLAGLAGLAFISLIGRHSFKSSTTLLSNQHTDLDLAWLDALVSEAEQSSLGGLCPQHEPYQPPKDQVKLKEPEPSQLAQLLSGAVQVDTSVGDAWPPVKDAPDLWGPIFSPFRAYLAKALPDVHAPDSPIKLTLVNQHGLLYTWSGSDSSLGPLLLMAHQDVVPVEPSTASAWVYPPFSGHITEEGNIFGRGTEDTKSSLVTILASLQSLMHSGFQPQRTILVSFGFDEEAAGTEGAGALATYIESVYGPGSIAMLVDEGGGFTLADPSRNIPATAAPHTTEKGYLDVSVAVQTPGGHSSVPPLHTGIGLLSQVITAIEQAPHTPVMRPAGVSNGMDHLLCGVAIGSIGGELKHALLRLHYAELHPPPASVPRQRYDHMIDVLRERALSLMDSYQQVLFTTTQAVDLIHGGVKVNALPERVEAVVNHRIEPSTNVQSVRKHLASVLLPVAKQHGLGLDAWGMSNLSYTPSTADKGTIVLSDAYDSALEPAPPTPVDGDDAQAWRLLASVIRNVWSDGLGQQDPIVVHPSLSIGNTDCKSFYNLARNVFRFSPQSINPPTSEELDLPEGWGAHTVNEHLHQSSLLDGWQFFTTLIKAVDQASF